MKVSKQGVLEIAEHEGIVLGPYKDSVGVWTYGVGHTKAAGGLNPEAMPKHDTRGWSYDQAQRELLRALQVFDEDLDKYEERVRQAISRSLKQYQFDALVSFDFNTGGIHRANLTRQINAGDMGGSGFMGWLRPPEIRKRRTAEMRLFQTGNYDANGDAIAVWNAHGDGRLSHRASISGAELARLMNDAGAAHEPAPPSDPSRAQDKLARIAAIINEED